MSTVSFEKIKKLFKDNKKPYYFISPSNFNLINLHQWVNNWLNINYINCYDNLSKSTIIPEDKSGRVFSSVEEINEYLLMHPESLKKIKSDLEKSKNGFAIFLFFNKELEEMCKDLNIKIILPENSTVKNIDNKITTTEIGNEANVFSVDNCLTKVDSYKSLVELANKNNLGSDWVIQTPFGDSGKTTFFITNEEDYKKHSEKIESEEKVKIMKRINCVGGAIEACATKKGTFVGPLLGELIGFEELTPYKGGWCGNELYQSNFDKKIRELIHEKTERLGDALYKRDYKGYFEVDYLIDLDTGDVYLGEINPRITGISAITNMSPFCQNTIPLFLLHLLEYSEHSIPLEPKSYNQLSLEDGASGTTSQMIIKGIHSNLKKVVSSPASGVYQLDENDELKLIKETSNPHEKENDPNKIYLLRIIDQDGYSYLGADQMILFLNIQITENKGTEINISAKKWINAANKAFQTRELTQEEVALNKRFTSPSNTKGSEG